MGWLYGLLVFFIGGLIYLVVNIVIATKIDEKEIEELQKGEDNYEDRRRQEKEG